MRKLPLFGILAMLLLCAILVVPQTGTKMKTDTAQDQVAAMVTVTETIHAATTYMPAEREQMAASIASDMVMADQFAAAPKTAQDMSHWQNIIEMASASDTGKTMRSIMVNREVAQSGVTGTRPAASSTDSLSDTHLAAISAHTSNPARMVRRICPT